MKKNITFRKKNKGGANTLLLKIFVVMLVLSVFGHATAGFTKFEENDRWYLSLGIGYQEIDKHFNAVQLGEAQVIRIDNNVYPVVRFGWMYTDHLILEAGMRYDIYSGKLRGNYIDSGSDLTGISLILGPAYRFNSHEVKYLGKIRPFVNACIGYRQLNMGLDYPVKDFDPSFGYEFSGGFTKGPFEIRAGFGNYRYSKDGTEIDYEPVGSSNRLDQSGLFIELSYLLSFHPKKRKEPVKEVIEKPVVKEPEVDDFEKVKSSDEITKIFNTVDETTNVSKEIFMKIEFDFDSDIIKPVSFGALNELGVALLNFDFHNNTLLIYGHADSDGPSKYNLDLSDRRAKSVRKYILEHFEIKFLDIKTQGFGEFKPLLPNTTAYNKMKNRRVEIMMKYDNNRKTAEGEEVP